MAIDLSRVCCAERFGGLMGITAVSRRERNGSGNIRLTTSCSTVIPQVTPAHNWAGDALNDMVAEIIATARSTQIERSGIQTKRSVRAAARKAQRLAREDDPTGHDRGASREITVTVHSIDMNYGDSALN